MTTQTATTALSTVSAKALHEGSQSITGSITASYTASAGLIFRLAPLPKGAVITDAKLAGGNGVALVDLGVTEDDNILIDNGAMSPTYIGSINVVNGVGYKTTTATWLIATTGTVSAASSNGVLRFSVTYHLDNVV